MSRSGSDSWNRQFRSELSKFTVLAELDCTKNSFNSVASSCICLLQVNPLVNSLFWPSAVDSRRLTHSHLTCFTHTKLNQYFPRRFLCVVCSSFVRALVNLESRLCYKMIAGQLRSWLLTVHCNLISVHVQCSIPISNMKSGAIEAALFLLVFASVTFTGANLPSTAPPIDPPPAATKSNNKSGSSSSSSSSNYGSSQKLAPCQSCRVLVKSFLLVSPTC